MRPKGKVYSIKGEAGGQSDRKLDICIFIAVQNLGDLGYYSIYFPVNLKPANVERRFKQCEKCTGIVKLTIDKKALWAYIAFVLKGNLVTAIPHSSS